jgi:hypothetical protein
MNREQWLTELAGKVEPMFVGYEFPEYRISCSWPSRSALSAKSRTIGECWDASCSADKTTEMMISMVLDDPIVVASTLVHEMVHATVGTKFGHKAPFKRCATLVGLEGKMTATHAGDELIERLNAIMGEMEPYPHAKLDGSTKKKQGTRMLKATCECGYTVRLTQKWADVGAPLCGQCHKEMEMA